jgi:hypothetical protein
MAAQMAVRKVEQKELPSVDRKVDCWVAPTVVYWGSQKADKKAEWTVERKDRQRAAQTAGLMVDQRDNQKADWWAESLVVLKASRWAELSDLLLAAGLENNWVGR